ncbi:hypothetical protein B0H16DRAFT_1734302 [Mycena metata]|uniref:Uncharacterized protein n=1 Tax=Mycena metata TaxID=1033252 RepID=A0AAD7HW50_9AGAR|nr:hypothetical protein B0H16DRAFT_1734302 [Mycena metata]
MYFGAGTITIGVGAIRLGPNRDTGCTASITPGVSVNKERRVPEEQDIEMPDVTAVVPPPEGAEGDIDKDDLDTELLIDSFERILVMSDDS